MHDRQQVPWDTPTVVHEPPTPGRPGPMPNPNPDPEPNPDPRPQPPVCRFD